MKAVIRVVFNLAIVTVISTGLYLSRNWPTETALFPRAIGFPVLALSLVTFVMGLFDLRPGWKRVAAEGIPPADRKFVVSAARIFGWLVGFAIAIWALGFQFAAPLFVLSYMRLEGRTSWFACVLFTVGAAAFIFIVFALLFHVTWPTGAVLEALQQ